MANRCSLLRGTSTIEVACFLFTNRLRRRPPHVRWGCWSPAIGPSTVIKTFSYPLSWQIFLSLIAVLVAFYSGVAGPSGTSAVSFTWQSTPLYLSLSETCSLHSHKAIRRMLPLFQGHKWLLGETHHLASWRGKSDCRLLISLPHPFLMTRLVCCCWWIFISDLVVRYLNTINNGRRKLSPDRSRRCTLFSFSRIESFEKWWT